MKYIQLYEQFNDVDPYGEEQWLEPDGTFLTWLKINHPDEKGWVHITKIDCSKQNLHALNGIENLVNLEQLSCFDNNLTELNEIENLINLKYLYCFNNKLKNLKIDNLTNLNFLSCCNNQLTNLNVSNLFNLKELFCHNNLLTKIDGIENLVKLDLLYFYNNRFSKSYESYLKEFYRKDNRNLFLSMNENIDLFIHKLLSFDNFDMFEQIILKLDNITENMRLILRTFQYINDRRNSNITKLYLHTIDNWPGLLNFYDGIVLTIKTQKELNAFICHVESAYYPHYKNNKSLILKLENGVVMPNHDTVGKIADDYPNYTNVIDLRYKLSNLLHRWKII